MSNPHRSQQPEGWTPTNSIDPRPRSPWWIPARRSRNPRPVDPFRHTRQTWRIPPDL